MTDETKKAAVIKIAFFKDWKDEPRAPERALGFQDGWYKGFDAGYDHAKAEYADLLWGKFMDFCKNRRLAPAEYNDLFQIVSELRDNQSAKAMEGKDGD